MTQTQIIYTTLELWGGIFCIVGAICVFVTRKLAERGINLITVIMILSSVLLFADTFAWRFERSIPGLTAVFYIVDFLVLALPHTILSLAMVYIAQLVSGRTGKSHRKMIITANCMVAVGVGAIIFSCFTGIYYWYEDGYIYHIGKYLNLHYFLCIAAILIMAVFILLNISSFYVWEIIALFIILFIVCTAYVYELPTRRGFSLSNIAASFAMIIILIIHSIECAAASARQTEELDRAKRQIYLRQIQPHFMLNSLTGIKQACDENDPETAGRLVEQFADFLKGSLSAISNTECISLTKEMQTVRSYMGIIKERFEGDVNVVYDLREVGFSVPPFSVQMLVENAVKHGVRKKPDGKGTISVKSRREGSDYLVEVSDDGAGFDVEQVSKNSEGQIGLKNVETRLRLMCSGKLEVESIPGVQTTVTMRIPDKLEARHAVSHS